MRGVGPAGWGRGGGQRWGQCGLATARRHQVGCWLLVSCTDLHVLLL
jgi:hypothetical protein